MSSTDKVLEAITAYKAIFAIADAEGRDLTSSEKKAVERHLAIAQRYKDAAAAEEFIGDLFGDAPSVAGYNHGGGIGDAFVKSAGYKSIKGDRPQTWTTGKIEVPYQFKGTLLETTSGGPGGGLTPPDYRAGVVETLFQPLTVADLLNTENTTGSQIRYVVEGTALNSAAAVAEGGVKPESTLVLSEVVEPVSKIATVLPISDELLDDAPAVQSYLNGRLSLFVRITEEDQLLYGNGTPPNLRGVLNRTGVQNHNRGTFTNLDAIRQMITRSRTSFLEPDAVVVHPAQWENIETLKDAQGGYYGDPFRGGPNTLWGKPVVVTNAVGSGTALVGSFKQAATLYRRGGLSLEISNSHSDYFVRNLNMVRCEQREALAVYRPASFVRGTALAA